MRFTKTAALAGLVLIGWQGCAHAQLAVSDAIVESMATDLDQVQEPNILAQDTLTAASVTTGGGAGLFTPAAGGVDPLVYSTMQDWNIDFPGWQPLSDDSTLQAIRIVRDLLHTDQGAMDTAQSQGSADLSGIENANASATSLLQAVQINTESNLAVASAQQTTNHLLSALLALEAANHAAHISIIAQAEASKTSQMLPDPGDQPEFMSHAAGHHP